MKKELTMTLIIFLALIAVSVCLRKILLTPAAGSLHLSYLGALIFTGAALLLLFGAFIRRLSRNRRKIFA